MVDGESWFVAGDVCRVLGLNNPTMALSRLDVYGLGTTEVMAPYGDSGEQRKRTAKIVNESDLYDLPAHASKVRLAPDHGQP